MQNLFDKASLVMVPSGYDNGKLYNIKPEDKGSAFEFERATMATRVNSSGLVETMFPEATNLFTYSNEFTNTAWNSYTNGLTRDASNIIDPDGGTNAWEITTTATNEHHRLGHTMTSGQIKTISFYAKANGYEYVRVWAFSGGNTNSNYFHLSGEGATGGNGQLNIKSIESVGNGWYRCQCVLDPNNNAVVVISPAPDVSTAQSTATYLADGTSGIYLYNAQLESGYFATPYIETTTQTVTRQNQANQPRIDYTSGEGALLLEPARTNVFAYSDDLSRTTNTNLGPGSYNTVTLNYAVSPDGTYTADRLEAYAPTGASYWALRGMIYTPSQVEDYTHSVWLKSNTGTTQNVIFYGRSFQGSQALCEVTTEWKRFYFTGTSSIENYFAYLGARPEYGSDNNIDVLVWGLQLEQGSYATSYIPTNGQQETRAADNLVGGISFPTEIQNSSQFTIFYESSFLDTSASENDGLRVDSPTGSQLFGEYQNTGERIFFLDSSNGTRLISSRISYTSNQFMKVAWVIDNNSLSAKLFIDGVLKNDASLLESFDLEDYRFGNRSTNLNYKELTMFPEALTDEELQRLTSPSADATTFTELANNNGYTIL